MMKLINKIKTLTELRRQNLDEIIATLNRCKVLVVALNLLLLMLIRLKRITIRFLNLIGFIKQRNTYAGSFIEDKISSLNAPMSLPPRLRILLVVEESIPHCFRYRVQQKIEQLEYAGHSADWVSWKDTEQVIQYLHFYHIVIFYRVPAFNNVLKEIDFAYSLRRILIADVDDLIFNKEVMEKNLELFTGLDKFEQEGLVVGADLYKQALQRMSYAIGSTPALCAELQKLGLQVYLHRNATDRDFCEFAKQVDKPSSKQNLSIFYGSGTKTHDKDFEVAAPALLQILKDFPGVRLVIGGYLNLPQGFSSLSERVIRLKFLSSTSYWEVLQSADINIAPLQSNIFSDSKSEIKWIEAGLLKVPSVVTPTRTYKEILHEGKDVFFAENDQQWYQKLSLLIKDKKLRHAMSLSAWQAVKQSYNLAQTSNNLQNIIHEVVQNEVIKKNVYFRSARKKKIVFVNVLYPPQDLGGATFMVKNQVDELFSKYSDKFELAVFTHDLSSREPYTLKEYEHNGVQVTAIGVPPGEDIDWRYKDDKVGEIFENYLQFQQPHLIHFHCVQRLTGSVLEIARKLSIPYLVTLHDAWWLCDRQFMINNNFNDCGQMHVDPLICSQCVTDVDESIKRRNYLKRQLENANLLLAVSSYQKELYQNNNFQNLVLNKNGIHLATGVGAKNCHELLKIGYLGGICSHKGYYFLKDVLKDLYLDNCQIIAVDFSQAFDQVKEQYLGHNKVHFISKISYSEMPKFWADIDVIVVPSIWRESFGLVAREANAHGVWVVAADSGALAEDIQEGKNGHIFEKGNSKQLAQILGKLNANISYYKSTRPDKSLKIKSVQEQVSELSAIYQKVLNMEE